MLWRAHDEKRNARRLPGYLESDGTGILRLARRSRGICADAAEPCSGARINCNAEYWRSSVVERPEIQPLRSKVVQTLSEHGYVAVSPGRAGGVSLAREADRIKLGDVVRNAETNMQVVECFDVSTNTCPILPVCQLKPVLSEALNAFLVVLDRYTLADLLNPRRRTSLAKLLAVSHSLNRD